MLINKKSYPFWDYVEAVAITGGVAIFQLANKHSESVKEDTLYGIILLVLYLFCDSFTSQWQSRVFKQYSLDQFQMMLGVNIWSLIMTGATLLQSGEGLESLAYIMSDSLALYHMIVLSITSAVGQLFIFYTIKEFGPVIFTIMMTTRQILSLFVSIIMFGHSLGVAGWVGSLLVFSVVFNRIIRKGSD